MPVNSRCGQCAIALLVYVLTATLLELYWMHPGTQYSVVVASEAARATDAAVALPAVAPAQQGIALPKEFSPPPPSPPSDATSPIFDARDAEKENAEPSKHARKKKKKKKKKIVQERWTPTDSTPPSPPPPPLDAASAAAIAIALAPKARASADKCWKTPRPFFEPPFDEAFASVVWAKPTTPTNGPLEDIASDERRRDWPPDRVARLERLLPSRAELESRRYGSCAVVGSSPELLLYKDGAAIDAHDAVFRANLAVTRGFEGHVGARTTVRVVNPVESIRKARSKGDDRMAVIKNQDPPAIRSPSKEHQKFLGEVESLGRTSPNYLARRSAIELCNYMLLASTLDDSHGGEPAGVDAATAAAIGENAAANERNRDPGLRKKRAAQAAKVYTALNLSTLSARFRAFAAGHTASWHPYGDAIPRFSPVHCSTGTVLLMQALLACKRVALYGYHSCSCVDKCSASHIAARNHYWDKKETPRFGEMMSRYEHHMKFYQRLEDSCDLDFRIARKDHCDR